MWLAGHEHDHMVQPIGYLDMLQAGELRMEERSNATILLGEFDEHTNVGNVTAHSWFPEGGQSIRYSGMMERRKNSILFRGMRFG